MKSTRRRFTRSLLAVTLASRINPAAAAEGFVSRGLDALRKRETINNTAWSNDEQVLNPEQISGSHF